MSCFTQQNLHLVQSNTSLTRIVDSLMFSGCNDDEDNENLFTSNHNYVGNGGDNNFIFCPL
mgnify:CR=1 FL=1